MRPKKKATNSDGPGYLVMSGGLLRGSRTPFEAIPGILCSALRSLEARSLGSFGLFGLFGFSGGLGFGACIFFFLSRVPLPVRAPRAREPYGGKRGTMRRVAEWLSARRAHRTRRHLPVPPPHRHERGAEDNETAEMSNTRARVWFAHRGASQQGRRRTAVRAHRGCGSLIESAYRTRIAEQRKTLA